MVRPRMNAVQTLIERKQTSLQIKEICQGSISKNQDFFILFRSRVEGRRSSGPWAKAQSWACRGQRWGWWSKNQQGRVFRAPGATGFRLVSALEDLWSRQSRMKTLPPSTVQGRKWSDASWTLTLTPLTRITTSKDLVPVLEQRLEAATLLL